MCARSFAKACFAGVLVLVAGCGIHEDLEIQPADEIPPGPGLFSGGDGEFTIVQQDVWSGGCRRGCGDSDDRPSKESEPD